MKFKLALKNLAQSCVGGWGFLQFNYQHMGVCLSDILTNVCLGIHPDYVASPELSV